MGSFGLSYGILSEIPLVLTYDVYGDLRWKK